MNVKKSLGLVFNAPQFFADPAFQAWLNNPDNCVMTWHKKGQVVGEFSDVVVHVDPSLNGEGTDSDMPEHIWDQIVALCKTEFPDLVGQNLRGEHIHVRLTNIDGGEVADVAQPEGSGVPMKTVRVAVIGECHAGGAHIEIRTITLPQSGYELGEHYEQATDQCSDDFEKVYCAMDENDPGAHLVLGLKKETNLSALLSHWEVKADCAKPGAEHPVFALNLKSQCEMNDQIYLDIERLNDSSEDPDMLSAIFEIGTDPVTNLDSPVVHLSGSSDDKLLSVFQRGNRLHLRLETGVTLNATDVATPEGMNTIYVLGD